MTDPREAKPGERLTQEQIEREADHARQYIACMEHVEEDDCAEQRALLQLHADLAEANAKLDRATACVLVVCDEAGKAALHPHGPQGRLAIAIDLMRAALADEPEET